MSRSLIKSKKAAQEKYVNNHSESHEYDITLEQLKKDIREVKVKAAKTINQELMKLYSTIDKIMEDRREKQGWNVKLLEKLICDLQNELPKLELFYTP